MPLCPLRIEYTDKFDQCAQGTFVIYDKFMISGEPFAITEEGDPSEVKSVVTSSHQIEFWDAGLGSHFRFSGPFPNGVIYVEEGTPHGVCVKILEAFMKVSEWTEALERGEELPILDEIPSSGSPQHASSGVGYVLRKGLRIFVDPMVSSQNIKITMYRINHNGEWRHDSKLVGRKDRLLGRPVLHFFVEEPQEDGEPLFVEIVEIDGMGVGSMSSDRIYNFSILYREESGPMIPFDLNAAHHSQDMARINNGVFSSTVRFQINSDEITHLRSSFADLGSKIEEDLIRDIKDKIFADIQRRDAGPVTFKPQWVLESDVRADSEDLFYRSCLGVPPSNRGIIVDGDD